MVLMQNVLCCVVVLVVFNLLLITNSSFYWRIRPLTEEEMYKFIPTNFKEKKKMYTLLGKQKKTTLIPQQAKSRRSF